MFGLEEKDCGCKVKHYRGGKTVLIGCAEHETSYNISWVCGICGKSFSNRNKGKKLLKEHYWTHAV